MYYDKLTGDYSEQHPADALPLNRFIKFDSKLEFAVYEILKRYIPVPRIILQVPIELKPKTLYSDKINYLVDFCVTDDRNNVDFFVEAKGLMLPGAKLKLKLLEILCPAIRSKLMIVSERKTCYFGKKYAPSETLTELKRFLGNKYGQ